MEQKNLTDIYRIFHPMVAEYSFFLSVHENFPRTGHILRYKETLSKFKNVEIISHMSSDHYGIR